MGYGAGDFAHADEPSLAPLPTLPPRGQRRHTIRDRHRPGRSRVCSAPSFRLCCAAPGTHWLS